MNVSFQKDPAHETPVAFLLMMVGAVIAGVSGSIGGVVVLTIVMLLDYKWQMAGNWNMSEADHDGVSAREYYFG
jgi:hypothetical protein